MANLFFGWLNFLILLLISRYIYLKWFKLQIQAAIKTKDNFVQDLSCELSSLENQVKEGVFDLALQEQQAINLLQKVQDWQAVYQQDLHVQAAYIKDLQLQIDTKNQIKLQNLALILAQKKLLTVALAQADSQLRTRFVDQNLTSSFLAQACDKLDRS